MLNPFAAADPVRRVDRQRVPLSVVQGAHLVADWIRRAKFGVGADSHVTFAVRLSSDVVVGALEAALNMLVARHDVLRMSFPDLDECSRRSRLAALRSTERFGFIPSSVCGVTVSPATRVRIEHLRQPTSPSDAPSSPSRDFACRSFDSSAAPLMRAALTTADDGSSDLLVVLHHLVADDLSVPLFCDELTRLYARSSRLHLDDRPPAEIQYGDYAAWQQAIVAESGEATTQLCQHYWREYCVAMLTVSDLARDAAGERSFEHHLREHRHVGQESTEQVRALARTIRVTTRSMWFACVAVALHSWTGAPRICVWNHFANRCRIEFEPLIGWFANALPVAVSVNPRDTMSTLATSTQAAMWAATDHSEIPTPLFIHAIATTDHDATVLADDYVSFDYRREMAHAAAVVSPLIVQERPIHSSRRQRSVDLSVIERGHETEVQCRYPPYLARDFVRGLLAGIVNAMNRYVAHPRCTVRECRTESGFLSDCVQL
jgi:hypothetical protein